MIDYNGPEVIVTSLARLNNKRSFHYRNSKALDIRLDKDGEKFLEWLKTAEGEAWLQSHGIRVFIEDRHRSRAIRKFSTDPYEDWILINPHASGPHIHVDLYNKYRT